MPAKKKKNIEREIERKIINTALRLASARGWSRTSMGDIARGAHLSLAELYAHFQYKHEILVGLGRLIDAEVLENVTEEMDVDLPPRDRLFEVMMARFDALNEHREGILAILKSFKQDPAQALISAPYLCSSMHWMLEAAGLGTTGKRGAIKIAGLTVLYLKVIRIWIKDDTPDLAKTMAALDKSLAKAERIANSLGLDRNDPTPPYDKTRSPTYQPDGNTK